MKLKKEIFGPVGVMTAQLAGVDLNTYSEYRTLTITIPGLLPAKLSPNWQPKGGEGFWRKNKVAKEYQYLVFISACDARNLWEREQNCKWQPLKKATLQITVYHGASGKQMDDSNLAQSLKSAIDALCSDSRPAFRAGIIQDDKPSCLTILKPKWLKGEPMIFLEVREVK